jgi:hypothetical protein
MLPHGMHMMMWWPKVSPCHFYHADMCRFAPIALCHVSLSDKVAVDVGQRVSAMWHVWGPLVRCPALEWDPLANMDQWERCHVAQAGSFFGSPSCTQRVFCPQVLPREA